jgi:hypothetical protein
MSEKQKLPEWGRADQIREDVYQISTAMADCNLPLHVIAAIGRICRKAMDSQPVWDHIGALMHDQGWKIKVDPHRVRLGGHQLVASVYPEDCGLVTYETVSRVNPVESSSL